MEELNVIQNINSGAWDAMGCSGRFETCWAPGPTTCLALMHRVRLEADLLEQPVRELSGGQRQRVALGHLLHQQADLVHADEPLSALDPSLAEDVLNTLLLWLSDGLHRPDLIHRFDRVLGLRDGALVINGAQTPFIGIV